jgi:hypothetical protein
MVLWDMDLGTYCFMDSVNRRAPLRKGTVIFSETWLFIEEPLRFTLWASGVFIIVFRFFWKFSMRVFGACVIRYFLPVWKLSQRPIKNPALLTTKGCSVITGFLACFNAKNTIFIYLHTFLLHREEFFVRNALILSRNSQHFMEVEVSLPHLQVPATCPYSDPKVPKRFIYICKRILTSELEKCHKPWKILICRR